jgi:hypothetical protein
MQDLPGRLNYFEHNQHTMYQVIKKSTMADVPSGKGQHYTGADMTSTTINAY